MWLERLKKAIEPAWKTRKTGRKLRAAVLHGSRNLKLEYISQEAIQPTQVLKEIPSAQYRSINLKWRQ